MLCLVAVGELWPVTISELLSCAYEEILKIQAHLIEEF